MPLQEAFFYVTLGLFAVWLALVITFLIIMLRYGKKVQKYVIDTLANFVKRYGLIPKE